MLGELIPNELGSASIYSDLMKKSPLETSTLEDTWSILIGQNLRVPPGLIDIYLLLYLFLLEIIINYKCPTIIGRNTYLDFVSPSNM